MIVGKVWEMGNKSLNKDEDVENESLSKEKKTKKT
jgi:hypothetical protein